ncbi:MAG: hypothetical protein IJU61_04640, partial [Victivallales bacterium]|nr:hypothetical protein [Victivallales bacterium]
MSCPNAGFQKHRKETEMRIMERKSRSVCSGTAKWLASVLLAAFAHTALCVTYTGSLPTTPAHPRYAYCGSFDVGLHDVLLDASDV